MATPADSAGAAVACAVQLLRQYARESYGLVTQAGWCRDSEAYLLMLRLAVDIQASAHSGVDAPDTLDLLREVLREWVLQSKDVGATNCAPHAWQ